MGKRVEALRATLVNRGLDPDLIYSPSVYVVVRRRNMRRPSIVPHIAFPGYCFLRQDLGLLVGQHDFKTQHVNFAGKNELLTQQDIDLMRLQDEERRIQANKLLESRTRKCLKPDEAPQFEAGSEVRISVDPFADTTSFFVVGQRGWDVELEIRKGAVRISAHASLVRLVDVAVGS